MTTSEVIPLGQSLGRDLSGAARWLDARETN